jgi:thymidylate synthase
MNRINKEEQMNNLNNQSTNLIGDAYKSYLIEDAKTLPNMSKEKMYELGYRLTKEEFINKIKTDNEFAKQWGVIVEVRELSLDERYVLANINGSKEKLTGEPNYTEEQQHSMLDELVPKRAISLMFNMRSTDVGLGLSFNLASYGLLLMMIAKQVNMIPDELIYNGGDVHLYKNHIEPIKEQLNRTPYELPTVELLGNVDDIAHYELGDIVLKSYKSHPTIKMPLSN